MPPVGWTQSGESAGEGGLLGQKGAHRLGVDTHSAPLPASANFQPASNLSVQYLRRSTSRALQPCRCKWFAIFWDLGIS